MTIPDSELIHRAQAGDSNAIGDLYLAHHERTFKYVFSRVLDPALAEDLTGDVFVRMVTRLPAYRENGVPFQAWLYRIARNLVFDHFRKANRATVLPLEEEAVEKVEPLVPSENAESLASGVENQFTQEHLQRALGQIDPDQAEVIRLRFMAGLSLKEVAERLDKTVAAVKALQHRGVVALRTILQQ